MGSTPMLLKGNIIYKLFFNDMRKKNIIYINHCKNLEALEKAITLIDCNIRNSIKTRNEDSEGIYTRILCTLIVSWLEMRLLKLINEVKDFKDLSSDKIFNNEEIKEILEGNSLLEKWKITLNLSAKKAYNVKLSKNLLDIQDFCGQKTFSLRYDNLISIIDKEFAPIITIRNKVDHGQIKYAYENTPISFSQDITADINKLNLIQLRNTKTIFKYIANIIHDLTVSKKTFERDYDKYSTIIDNTKSINSSFEYKKYKKMMIQKQLNYKQKLIKIKTCDLNAK